MFANLLTKRRKARNSQLPYPCEKGPWAVHLKLGQDWGDGPMFEVSVSRLYAKERPGKVPTLATSFK